MLKATIRDEVEQCEFSVELSDSGESLAVLKGNSVIAVGRWSMGACIVIENPEATDLDEGTLELLDAALVAAIETEQDRRMAERRAS